MMKYFLSLALMAILVFLPELTELFGKDISHNLGEITYTMVAIMFSHHIFFKKY